MTTSSIISVAAIKGKMGPADEGWEYYSVTLTMQEIALYLKYAHDVRTENKSLSDLIQRDLNSNRSIKDIAGYLAKDKNRFFGSIIVAAYGGNPTFTPYKHPDVPKGKVGILKFDSDIDLYALDGQHRLFAIKSLVSSSNKNYKAPYGFNNESVSVIILFKPTNVAGDNEDWVRKYRRLFSHLNSHAKSVSKSEQIALNEDNAVHITTRRLISENENFQSTGKETEHQFIKFKGNSININDTYFTTLMSFDLMNHKFLSYPKSYVLKKQNLLLRPEDDELDKLFYEVDNIWEAVLDVFPDIRRENWKNFPSYRSLQKGKNNTVLVRPIIHETFAEILRNILDRKLTMKKILDPTQEQIKEAFNVFSDFNFDLFENPVFNLLVEWRPDSKKYNMRDDQKAPAQTLTKKIFKYACGFPVSRKDLNDYKSKYYDLLLLENNTKKSKDEKWKKIIGSHKHFNKLLDE